jgi:hypothetical protein
MVDGQKLEHVAGTLANGRTPTRGRWKTAFVTVLLILSAAYFGTYYSCRMPGGEVRIGNYGSTPEIDIFFFPARIVADGPVRKLADVVKRATTDDAERLVGAALKQAEAENKRVLLVICTTRCLPCRQLDGFFKKLAPLLNRHLVVLKLNIDALQNGAEVHRRFRKDIDEAPAYIPWMAVLDSTGNVLHASPALQGKDTVIALPQGNDADRRYFVEMLRSAAPSLSEPDLQQIESAATALHDRIWGAE